MNIQKRKSEIDIVENGSTSEVFHQVGFEFVIVPVCDLALAVRDLHHSV